MTEVLRKFVDAFRAGGIERSTMDTVIEISSNGTSSVPTGDLEKIVFRRFADMNRADESSIAESEHA